MYVKVKCPQCQKALRVREELSGRKCACPHCKASIRIPEIAAGSSLSLPETAPAPDLDFEAKSSAPPPFTTGKRAPVKQAVAVTRPNVSISSGKWTDSSNVSLPLSGFLGLTASVFFLALMLLVRNIQLGQLFWDRGFVPFVLTLLMFWSFAILLLKWAKIKRQRTSMLLDALPTELSQEITVDTIDKFGSHILSLPGEPGESFLLNRVIRGLEHFRVRKSAAETATMMASQSEIDANNVVSSYTILKVFIWALPILGFIGTVIGISAAVGGLGGSLENSSDVSALKGALNNVFDGLKTAFDTTLLALIMSMMVKIPASAIQKAEQDLVTQVDEYCNENLLRRLNDGRDGGAERGAGGGQGIDAAVFRRAVEEGMATHQVELERWLKKLDAIGGKLTSQVAQGWAEINTRSQQQHLEFTADLARERQATSQNIDDQLEQMATSAARIQETLAGLAERATELYHELAPNLENSADRLETQFASLERGLGSLSAVLERLGEQQVVIQQVEAQRRGWFSRKRNGRS